MSRFFCSASLPREAARGDHNEVREKHRNRQTQHSTCECFFNIIAMYVLKFAPALIESETL